MAHNIPDKEDFKDGSGKLLRQLYVVACINALSPQERKQVFLMFNIKQEPTVRASS